MSSKTKKILVVDDNPNNLSLVTSLIKPYYEVLLANNGEKALNVAKSKNPDLILLDIMMPDISGFEVCERLKADTKTNTIPIIFLTAKTSGDDFEKAYEVGGVDYVTKPVNAKELLARIKTHLTICEQNINLKNLNLQILKLNNNLETKIKDRTLELEKAIVELGKQNSELEQASYVISHNLRGPVANILGLKEIFNRKNLGDPFNGQVFDHLEKAISNLDSIVKDLSMVITMRNSVPEFEEVDIKNVVDEALVKLQDQVNASEAKIEILEMPKISSVRSYMDNIFLNLLSNALKYKSTEQLHIKVFSKQDEDGIISMYISDNGIGIEPAYKSKIFEPYKNMSMEPGKGLGLYLVKTQIEALGGKVAVISEPGKGATFSISI